MIELFITNWKPDHSVAFVIDVVPHNQVTGDVNLSDMVMGDVDLSGMGNEGGRKSQGKGINMNPDGFIMAYEAVHKELNATARDEWMATIIGGT